MVQGKMKKKTQLPAGTKQKIKKVKSVAGPKKGTRMILPAKKASAVAQVGSRFYCWEPDFKAKVGATVSQIINEKNEQMIRMRADKSQGRTPKSKK